MITPETSPDTLNVERHWYEYARKKIDECGTARLWAAVFMVVGIVQAVALVTLGAHQPTATRPVEHCEAIGIGEKGQVLSTDSGTAQWVTPDQHLFSGVGGGGGGYLEYYASSGTPVQGRQFRDASEEARKP